MKTAQEILQKHYELGRGLTNPDYVIEAMKEHTRQYLDLAAEEAKKVIHPLKVYRAIIKLKDQLK